MRRDVSGGFTLVEVLIVVAIIVILVLIAVPNYQRSQVRAKVASAKADMRAMATAFEAYCADRQDYPLTVDDPADDFGLTKLPKVPLRRLVCLTTPMAYMSSIPDDRFLHRIRFESPTEFSNDWIGNPLYTCYNYARGDVFKVSPPPPPGYETPRKPYAVTKHAWLLSSAGPDNELLQNTYVPESWLPADESLALPDTLCRYDPTNGTTSYGDLYRWGP